MTIILTFVLGATFGLYIGAVLVRYHYGKRSEYLLLEQIKGLNSVIKDLHHHHDKQYNVIKDLSEKYIKCTREKANIIKWGAGTLARQYDTIKEVGERLSEIPGEYQPIIDKIWGMLINMTHKDHDSFVEEVRANTDIQEIPEVKELQSPIVSGLHGCVAGDVVEKIVQALGPDLIKGVVNDISDEDFIYLEPVSSKEIQEIINLLEERFGIEAWLNTANYRPTICFSADAHITK